MSYVVSITRGEEKPIQLNEFEKAVSNDPEFTKAPECQDHNSPSYIWTTNNSNKESYFHYWQPNIAIESPSYQALIKIQQLAKKLDANVIGEEGEDLSDINPDDLTPADDGGVLKSFINTVIVIVVLISLYNIL